MLAWLRSRGQAPWARVQDRLKGGQAILVVLVGAIGPDAVAVGGLNLPRADRTSANISLDLAHHAGHGIVVPLAHPCLHRIPCGGKHLSTARTEGVSPRPGDDGVLGAQGSLDDREPENRSNGLRHDQAEVPRPRGMAKEMVGQAHAHRC